MKREAERHPLLIDFPIVVETPVAWGEMDSFGHVNNIVYFRWFESARIAYLDAIRFRNPEHNDGVGPILGSTHCRFRKALQYPDTVQAGARTVSLSPDRFTMEYRIVSVGQNAVAAEGGGVVVAYSYSAEMKAQLPIQVCERIRELDHIETTDNG